jgi:CRP-like cAMP-binding protein
MVNEEVKVTEDSQITLLSQTRVFNGLALADMQRIIACGNQVDLDAGELFMQEGLAEDTLWLVVEGEAEVFKLISGNIERTLAFVREGEILGELEFVSSGARAASARTTKPGKFLCIRRNDFDNLLNTQPQIAAVFYLNIAATIGERLRTTNEMYRESVAFGMQSVGAAALNLHNLVQDISLINVTILSGQVISGRLLQLDQNPAGYCLVLKEQSSGKLVILPFHGIQAITVG